MKKNSFLAWHKQLFEGTRDDALKTIKFLLQLGVKLGEIKNIHDRAKCDEQVMCILIRDKFDRTVREMWLTKDLQVKRDQQISYTVDPQYGRTYAHNGKVNASNDLTDYDDRRDRLSNGELAPYQGTFGQYSN